MMVRRRANIAQRNTRESAGAEGTLAVVASKARLAAADHAALVRVASAVPSTAHTVADVDGRKMALLARPACIALAPTAVDASV